MKKGIVITGVLLVLTVWLLAGCTSGVSPDGEEGGLSIVCTIFPQYDWIRNIIGEDNDAVSLTLLLDNGTDIHSYQPTAADIAKISSCDVLVYVGGESDSWAAEVLEEASASGPKAISLMDILEEYIMEEEIIEGMESGGHHDDEAEYDEHVWLSLKNAAIICGSITETLVELDEENADIYRDNSAKYMEGLKILDEEYQQMVENSSRKTILFGDRFPFRYLTEDYGLEYYAAFAGCSAETEASFETIAFLSEKLDEEDIPVIFVIDNSNTALAKTIAANTASGERKILSLNSMQSVTAKDIEAGETYLSIMESNLELFREALYQSGE